MENNTLTFVPPLEGNAIIKNKWVHRVKSKEDKSLENTNQEWLPKDMIRFNTSNTMKIWAL